MTFTEHPVPECIRFHKGFIGNVPEMYIAEKAMATHSSTLDWKIPWTEEPGGLPSMGSGRVGHD